MSKSLSITDLGGGDFDYRNPSEPGTTYVLAATARSGSTLLAVDFWRARCLGRPLEYFNPRMMDRLEAALTPSEVYSYSKDVFCRRTGPNHVFGTKLFVDQIEYLEGFGCNWLELLKPTHIVFLTRLDKVAQAVSLYKAHVTAKWFSYSREMDVVEYSFEGIAWCLGEINRQELSWRSIMDGCKLPKLQLCFEDFLSARSESLIDVALFLGAEPVESAMIELPLLDRQSDAESAEWCRRFRLQASKKEGPGFDQGSNRKS